jgi:putative ABC transport system substrate-binding protein
MRSRAVSIFGLALSVLVPLFADAQQPKKVPRIGYLTIRSGPSEPEEALRQGLRDLGYVEGQNIIIEYRFAGGTDRLPEMAAELVRLKVDVFVAASTPAVQAAKNATKTIPIVMAAAADPVGTGFVASLARPGGNITGLSLMLPDLAGKRLELLREVLPGVAHVAFLAHGGDTAYRRFLEETQVAAQKLGVQIQPVVIKGPNEFEGAFSAMVRERAGALIVQPFFVIVPEQRRRVVDLAARNRLPAISDLREFADAGALMSYGPHVLDQIRRAAAYVDKILKGAKPADLPVEQPTRFELVINMKTAKALGLTIPQSILIRADHVIQ